jgi:hypothetical protein
LYAVTQLQDLHVAIDASEVAGFETMSAGIAALDLAVHLGVPPPPAASRRVAWLQGDDAAIVLGQSVRFVEVQPGDLHALPSFVAERLRALAIDRLVALEHGFAYVLAPKRLERP